MTEEKYPSLLTFEDLICLEEGVAYQAQTTVKLHSLY